MKILKSKNIIEFSAMESQKNNKDKFCFYRENYLHLLKIEFKNKDVNFYPCTKYDIKGFALYL